MFTLFMTGNVTLCSSIVSCNLPRSKTGKQVARKLAWRNGALMLNHQNEFLCDVRVRFDNEFLVFIELPIQSVSSLYYRSIIMLMPLTQTISPLIMELNLSIHASWSLWGGSGVQSHWLGLGDFLLSTIVTSVVTLWIRFCREHGSHT